jgi:long-subunit acyl-CoA synthetase (AMP-forming)
MEEGGTLNSLDKICRIDCLEKGRVLTCGLHVMERYWRLPEETTTMLSRDGWLDTRDDGWMGGDGQ